MTHLLPTPLAARRAGLGLALALGLCCTPALAGLPQGSDGAAPPPEAMALGHGATLALGGELRLRQNTWHHADFVAGKLPQQALLRGVLGADLHLGPGRRVYAELATGQVAGGRTSAGANFQNRLALQQLYVDLQQGLGPLTLGTQVGRLAFADGPRQLISLSDGPNLRRSWNGARGTLQGPDLRLGVFDLRGTQLGPGAFDDGVRSDERLQGANASLRVSPAGAPPVLLDPFWLHTRQPVQAAGGQAQADQRDTYGARLWGQHGSLQFDWTLARQTGRFMARRVDAWGLFAVQSLALSEQGWRPRIGVRLDIASGGSAIAAGRSTGFNPLYASASYLGDGQFLGASNLLLLAPGLTVAPSAATRLSIEYGLARRLQQHDAAYAGQLRAYPGTQQVAGHEIGGLLRIAGSWALSPQLSLFADVERLVAGQVLKDARLPSGSYGHVGASLRF